MNILIVDDEIQIRNGIKEAIKRASLGFEEILIADNGIDAYELFKKHLPEIIITDIRMPVMDGLELCKKIKELSPSAKVIILSGYQEFEYAKKAMQLGVTDYELKPVKVKNLIKLITKAKEDVHKKLTKEKEVKDYKEVYKTKFLEDCLHDRIHEAGLILDNFLEFYNFDGKGVLVCIDIEIDNYYIITSGMTEEQTKSMNIEAKKIINDWLNITGGIVFNKSSDTFIVIYKPLQHIVHNNSLNLTLQNFSNRLNDAMNLAYKATISMGVSNCGNVYNIHELYRQSTKALEYKLYKGKGALIPYSETNHKKGEAVYHYINEKELKENISNFDYEGVYKIINSEFNNIKKDQRYKLEDIKSICIVYINNLISTIRDLSIDFDELFKNNIKYFNEINRYDTIDDYKEWILDIYKVVMREVSDLKGIRSNSIIFKSIEYIKKNFSKDISVEILAAYIEKTPNYFSHLFKKEFGMSYCDYLNRVRINEAKSLIKNSNILSYEVAERVGFKDYKYFNKVFRKFEGCSPSEYRKSK